MSARKFFNLFTETKPTYVSEDLGEVKFERRVSVSHSGRWKQKNKQRLSLRNDTFETPYSEQSPTGVIASPDSYEGLPGVKSVTDRSRPLQLAGKDLVANYRYLQNESFTGSGSSGDHSNKSTTSTDDDGEENCDPNANHHVSQTPTKELSETAL